MRKVGVSVIVLLMASMLIGCVPSEIPSPTPTQSPSPPPSPRPPATHSPAPSAGAGFSIYLLADDVPATELTGVALRDLQLRMEPLVSARDIISYSRESHEIELTGEAYERIRQLFTLPVRVQGMPFVVCVGDDRIYAGAFMTPASSISYDGVVILEPFDADRHIISIVLGYPSPEAFTGQDPRSDPRVFESLHALGKLH